MRYFCTTCAYECTNKSNLNKHLKSAKHSLKCIQGDQNEKVLCIDHQGVVITMTNDHRKDHYYDHQEEKVVVFDSTCISESPNNLHSTFSTTKSYMCKRCMTTFTDKSNMYRHKRRYCNKDDYSSESSCQENQLEILSKIKKSNTSKKDIEVENRILKQKLEYEKKLRELESQMKEELKKQVEELKDDKEFTQKVSENTAKIANKSVSALNFVMKNMKDAPILKALPNDDIKKMLDYSDKSDTYMVESIIFAYQQNNLIKLLGDAIIKNYKKDNPKLQSLWNTDVSRLTYIVRLTVHDEDDWVVDKQGVRTNKIIIEPFLLYLKDKVMFIVKNFNKIDKLKAMSEIDFLKYSTKFINEIETGCIKNEITKYIAPYLALERAEHKSL